MKSIKNGLFPRGGRSFMPSLPRFGTRGLLPLIVLAAGFALSPALRAQTELGVEDDLTVLGTDGAAGDPDVEIKGFTVFGSAQDSYPGAVQVGPGSVVVNGYLSVSSGAYFAGVSSFSDVAKTYMAGGVAGDVLAKDAVSGSLKWMPLSAVSAINVSSAANLMGGAAGYIPWQSAGDTTAMLAPGAAGYLLQSNGAAAPSWTNAPALAGTNFTAIPWTGVNKAGSSLADLATKSAGDLTSGTLALVRGGTGANLSGTGGAGQLVRQDTAGAALTVGVLEDADVPDTITIDGTGNVTWASVSKTGSSMADLEYRSASDLNFGLLAPMRGGTGANLSAAASGGVPWFTGAGVMAAVPPGPAGFFLKSNGLGAPSWESTSGVAVSSAANLAGGVAGSIPWQSAANTTSMLPAGTAGYLLQANGAASPVWTNTPALVGTNFTAIPWTGVNKTGSSLADLATRSAGDLTSGTLAVARGGTGSNLAATGGINQIVRQNSAGAPFTVSALLDADIPDTISIAGTGNVTWASVNKTGSSLAHLAVRSAGDLNSGLLAPANGGSGADLSLAVSGGVPWFTGSGVMGAVPQGASGFFLMSNGAASPSWASASGVVVSSAINMVGGAAGSLPWQSAPNTTAMLAAGTAGYILQTNGAAAPTWTNTPALVGTNFTAIPWTGVNKTGSSLADLITRSAGDLTSGTLALARGGTGSDLSLTGGPNQLLRQNVAGGGVSVSALADADVPDSITINGTDNVTWASVNKTGSSLGHLATRSAGDLNSGLLSPAYGGTGANLSAAASGGVPWFAGAGVMGAVPPGPAGFFLKSNGAGAPTWETTSGVAVSSASNIAGGAAGSFPWQSAPNTTAMLAAGTAGYILQTNGAAAPTWTNTPALVGTNFTAIPWTGVNKTGSSLADLITRSAGDLTSGTLALARGGTGSDLSATGGANQVVRQNSAGGIFTVSALADADIPDAITINGTNNVTWASVNKTGSSLADLATRSAGDLTSGTLALARGGTGSNLAATGGANQVVRQSSAGGAFTVGALADADIPDAITINGTNNVTWASVNKTGSSLADLATKSAGDINSGTLALARGGTGSNLSATGGANQVVRQDSVGGGFTVSALTDADIPDNITLSGIGNITWASINKTGSSLADLSTKSAGDLTSGTLALARGGTGSNLAATGGANQFVKQTSAGGAFSVGTIVDADVPNSITIDTANTAYYAP